MIINSISPEEELRLKAKFESFDVLMEKGAALGYLKLDPSLFAYFFFQDGEGQRFRVTAWQDKFLNSNNPRKLLCCCRQIGKTTVVSIDALHKAFFHNQYTILVVSRTKPQAKEVVYRMKTFLKTSRFTTWKELLPGKKENQFEIIITNPNRKTESRIIVVPATDAALGYTASKVLCDEAAYWEDGDYVFKEVIQPTTTWTKGDICLLSTPGPKAGFFWEAYNNPDWEVYHFDWKFHPKLTADDISRIKRGMTSLEFARQYEAKFTAGTNNYFNPKDIENAKSDKAGVGALPADASLMAGVDFGKVNDNSVIYLGFVENPSAPVNEQIVRVFRRISKPLGTNYDIVLGEIKGLYHLFKDNWRGIILDTTSGEPPADILIADGVPGVIKFAFSWKSKPEIYSNLNILLEQKRLRIPDELELINQLELMEYEYTSDARMKVFHPVGGHDDECDALAMLCYALVKNAGGVSLSFVEAQKSQDASPWQSGGKKSLWIPCVDCDEYFPLFYDGDKPEPPYNFKCGGEFCLRK